MRRRTVWISVIVSVLGLEVAAQTTSRSFRWGTSHSDAYAAGWREQTGSAAQTGVLLHYNGQAWTAVREAETELGTSLWAASPTDVFVTGTTLNGLNDVRHFDGSRLSTVLSDARFGSRSAVWSAPTGEVFVVGQGGSVFRGVPGPR
jgi:hypothetical protein